MPKDVVVVVNIDAKPSGTENLDILLLSTEGAKDVAVYRDLDVIKEAFTGKKVAAMAEALFEQGKTTLAETLIRKVKIAGIAAPDVSGETEKASALVEAVETLRETDDDWYILLTDQDGDEAVKALCAWAEATEPTEAELGAGEEDHRKLYFGRTQNKSLAVTNRRSIVIYGDQDEEYPDAAYVGNVGPFYPESVTWKFKRPQGLTVPDLTNAERDALEEANVNFLTVEYKREYVKNGVCADGEFIDVQMGADYIAKNMRENLYDIFLENPTITLDLSVTATGEVLAYGDPIRYGRPLFGPIEDERFPLPVIIPLCLTGDDVDAVTWENLGEEVKLYLFDREGTE